MCPRSRNLSARAGGFSRICGILLAAAWLAMGSGSSPGQGPEPQLPREAAAPAQVMQQTPRIAQGQSPFLGGVPEGTATTEVLPLSLAEAIDLGLRHNLGLLLSEQGVRSADGARWKSRSELLPKLEAGVSETREKINLESYGFPVAPGESPILGPFNVFDGRFYLTQKVFDYGALEAARADRESLKAAGAAFRDARDEVVFVCASLYLEAVTAVGRIDAARAQLDTAQALYDRSVAMKEAGTAAGIEVLRAQVQLQAQQQRVIFNENEFSKEKLKLARAVGLPLGQALELTDRMTYSGLESMTVEGALETALRSRQDFESAQALVRAAEASLRSALGKGLPSVGVAADIGKTGATVDGARETFSMQAAIELPLFQGGRQRGRLLEADAALREQQARLADLRSRIEYEIRSALLDVGASDERVHVAQSALSLANEQLSQAQDRFAAGVVNNIEVVQAQEAVATASDNYLSALYSHNLAKLSLARALGMTESAMESFLSGAK
jgi:outer membrane protein TolC